MHIVNIFCFQQEVNSNVQHKMIISCFTKLKSLVIITFIFKEDNCPQAVTANQYFSILF